MPEKLSVLAVQKPGLSSRNSSPAWNVPSARSTHHFTPAWIETLTRSGPRLPRTMMVEPACTGIISETPIPLSELSMRSAVIQRGWPILSFNSTRRTRRRLAFRIALLRSARTIPHVSPSTVSESDFKLPFTNNPVQSQNPKRQSAPSDGDGHSNGKP